jgi:hypothetical protein
MAQKQTILEGHYTDKVDIMDDLYALDCLTGSQTYSVLLCLTEMLPAQVKLEQRSPKGPIDLTVDNFLFKINQRAKVSQRVQIRGF